MFYILSRTLDTSGGASPYSYATSKKSLEDAMEFIEERKVEHTRSYDRQNSLLSNPMSLKAWESLAPQFIITKLVA